MWPTFVAATAVAIVLLVLGANFNIAEKKIERSVKRLYDVADPPFRRATSALLGPPGPWPQRALEPVAMLLRSQL